MTGALTAPQGPKSDVKLAPLPDNTSVTFSKSKILYSHFKVFVVSLRSGASPPVPYVFVQQQCQKTTLPYADISNTAAMWIGTLEGLIYCCYFTVKEVLHGLDLSWYPIIKQHQNNTKKWNYAHSVTKKLINWVRNIQRY